MCKNQRLGFTLVELMIVVIIIGLLLAIAAPGFLADRTKSRAATVCRSLREILGAKDEYIMTNQLVPGQPVNNAALVPTYLNVWPSGPVSGTYDANPVGTDPTFQGENEAWYEQHCLGTADSLCTL